MRNAALPRDLALTVAPPLPLPLRSFWRSRRHQPAPPTPAAAARPATLRRLHGSTATPAHPTPDHPVLVHDHTLCAVDLRSRLPLDVCGHYHLHSDAHGGHLQGSRVRVVGCRRQPDGLYAIAAEICR